MKKRKERAEKKKVMLRESEKILGIYRCKEELIFTFVLIFLAAFLTDYHLIPSSVVGTFLIGIGIGLTMEGYFRKKIDERNQ